MNKLILDSFNIIGDNKLVGKIIEINKDFTTIELYDISYFNDIIKTIKTTYYNKVKVNKKLPKFLYEELGTIYTNFYDIVADVEYTDYTNNEVVITVYDEELKDSIIDFVKNIYKGFAITIKEKK